MTSTEKFDGGKFGSGNSGDEKFDAELRAAMAPVPASANLKREILLLPLEFPRLSRVSDNADMDMAAQRQPWYAAILGPMSLGGVAAAVSLALGLFAGIGGFSSLSQSADEVDLATLAYDQSSSLGDL
jgi:hypothetical protein